MKKEKKEKKKFIYCALLHCTKHSNTEKSDHIIPIFLNKSFKTEVHSPLCELYIYIYIYIYIVSVEGANSELLHWPNTLINVSPFGLLQYQV